MKHTATISEGPFEKNPVHVQCSCNVAGDFATESIARQWMQRHFDKLTGIAYGEFSSAPTPSEPVPVQEESVAEGLKKNEPENETETPLQNETVGDA